MKRGFTLVEILVAVTIFVSVVAVASSLFVSAIQSQRRNLAYQELLDQTSYVMEYMSRSIRMAKRADGTCTVNSDYNYEAHTWNPPWGDITCLHFKNYKDECQYFCLHLTSSRLMTATTTNLSQPPPESEFTFLTSPDLTISSFNVIDKGWQKGDTLQPLVAIFLEIKDKEQSSISIQIQTSISQRNLDM